MSRASLVTAPRTIDGRAGSDLVGSARVAANERARRFPAPALESNDTVKRSTHRPLPPAGPSGARAT